MRFLVGVLVLVFGGCSPPSFSAVSADGWGWARFDGFDMQVQASAPGLTWEQAEASCAALDVGAHLPTELQYTAAHAVAFHGVERPTAREWFWTKAATPTSYDAGRDTYYFDPPPDDLPVAFRCARSRVDN